MHFPLNDITERSQAIEEGVFEAYTASSVSTDPYSLRDGGADTAPPRTSETAGAAGVQDAIDFLEMLQPDGRFTFQTFSDVKGDNSSPGPRQFHGSLKEHAAALYSLNEAGSGVFATINETDGRGRKKANITRPRALFVDFDTVDHERIDWLMDAASLPPTMIVETSPGKHHVYWVTGGLTLGEWKHLQDDLAHMFKADGADAQVNHITSVMRLPGFWHQKGDPFLSRLVTKGRNSYSAAEIRLWVPPAASTAKEENARLGGASNESDGVGVTLPVRNVTLNVASEALSYCHNADREYDDWLAVGMALHHQFDGAEEAFQLWREWSLASNKASDENYDRSRWRTLDAAHSGARTIRSLLQEAEANGWQRPAGVEGAPAAAHDFPELPPLDDQPAPAAMRPPLLRPVGELLRHPPQLYWLVSGIMEHPTIGQIFGDPSSGKSFVALDISACVATGTSWHDHTVTKGPVVYVAGEGYAGVLRRLKAWEIDRELPLEGIPLHVSSGAVEFSSAETVKRLWDELDALEQPLLIVIDTLARAATGWDENSTKDMGMFMSAIEQLARRYDCSVLLVHHSGHGNSDRGRGASSIPAALDMSMRLENKQGVRRLDCTKMKDSEEFPSEHFELRPVKLPPDWMDSDGERIVSAVLVESSRGAQAVSEKPTGKNQRPLYEIARGMAKEVQASTGADGRLYVAELKKRWAERGFAQKRFTEAKDGLVSRGFIFGNS